VVVGAGIGGLAASLVLSRVAARVALVERAARPSEVGAALALQPNGMAVWTVSDAVSGGGCRRSE
jgi:2-polyprenyl-6-methoxyphenol hydroxylase-like FAD-dependent oxidoreductase